MVDVKEETAGIGVPEAPKSTEAPKVEAAVTTEEGARKAARVAKKKKRAVKKAQALNKRARATVKKAAQKKVAAKAKAVRHRWKWDAEGKRGKCARCGCKTVRYEREPIKIGRAMGKVVELRYFPKGERTFTRVMPVCKPQAK